ncbi:MAG TPA: RNA polymerase subunit sigma-24 [Bacteroidetes bacterium]|nr:RNA polymerase subunit sigma-24 [Bacteroidota bacterium]
MKDKTSNTDFELVNKVLNGDDSCFEELINRHQSLVASVAMNMLGDWDEAQEIGHQVFIRFYKSLSKFKREAKVSTYLTRISMNLSLNALKRRKVYAPRSYTLEHAGLVYQSDLSTDIANKELINKGLQMLEEKHRSVVTLRMILGYDTIETANILGIPKGTVLSRLKRGIDKLKVILITDLKYEHT